MNDTMREWLLFPPKWTICWCAPIHFSNWTNDSVPSVKIWLRVMVYYREHSSEIPLYGPLLSRSWLMLMAICICLCSSTPTEQSLITCLDGIWNNPHRETPGEESQFAKETSPCHWSDIYISSLLLLFLVFSFLTLSKGWVDKVKYIIYSCAYWFHLKFNSQISTDSIRKQ